MNKAKAAVCLVSSMAQIIVNQGTFPCPKEIFKETLCIMKQIRVCFVAPDLHLYSCEINGKFLLTLTGPRLDLSASGV